MGKWSDADGLLQAGSVGTVLVVDDEPESLELLRALLVSQGYTVLSAPSSEVAIGLVERGGVDLVVCDLMMARMDGVELCAHIRGALGLLHLPIVFVTSLHDRASRIRAKEAGADDFLVKPVDGLELLVRVESLLRTRAITERAQRERNQLLVALSAFHARLAGEPVGSEASEAGLVARLAAHGRELVALCAPSELAHAAPHDDRVAGLLVRARELEDDLRALAEQAERTVAAAARR